MKKIVFASCLLTIGFAYAQQRPTWIHTPPQSDGKVEYFVGMSLDQERDEKIAQEHATRDAFNKLSQHLRVEINTRVKEEYAFAGLESDTFDYQVQSTEITTYVSEAKVAKLTLVEWYKESTTNSGGTAYKGYGLFSIPLSEIKKYGDEILAEDISKEWAPRRIAAIDTFTGAAQTYDTLVTNLQNNQTLRTKAYYDTGKKKVNLYEYAKEQLRNLSNSITVEVDPLVQAGDALAVRVKSNAVPHIGDIKCRVRVNGKNAVEYTLGAEDTFAVFETDTLAKGKYTLQYELLLKDAVQNTNATINNKSGKANFEVAPPLVYINFEGDLEDKEKQQLMSALQSGIQQNKVPMQILKNQNDTGNHYRIVITLAFDGMRKTFNSDRDNFVYKVYFSLQKNNIVVVQAETKTVEYFRRDFLIKEANDFIKENKEFYLQVTKIIRGR